MKLNEINALKGKPVRILKHLWEDAYGEEGYYGYIESIIDDPRDDTLEVTVNYEAFREYNRVREPAVYINQENRGGLSLTATEAGWYPKNHREQVYFMRGEENPVSEFFVEGLPCEPQLDKQLEVLMDYARRNGMILAADHIKNLL